MTVPFAKLGLATRAANEIANPLAGLPHIGGVLRIRADARDPDELGELVEPSLFHGA
jgi:hypothetical protein